MIKKRSTTNSFLTLTTAFVVMVGFCTTSWAQAPEDVSHVDTVLEQLNTKEAQAQAQIQPLQATADQLKAESEKIKVLQKQTETQLEALKETSVTLTLQAFAELVLNNEHGSCRFTQSASNPREFIISKDEVKIRFVLASEDSNNAKKPTVKKVLVNGEEVIQYEQIGWSDKNSSDQTFRAVIQTTIGKERILRSMFNGERINDRGFMSFFSAKLPAESPISCLLLN